MNSLRKDRLERFQRLLAEAGFDAYFASSTVTMGYLADFFEGGGERMLLMAIPAKGEPAMIVPELSATHAQKTGIRDIRTWKDGEDPDALFERLAIEWGLQTSVIAVDDEMPANYLLRMQQALPAALFKCGGDISAQLRKRKDPEELALMRKAAEIADAAFDEILKNIKVGMTEKQVARIILEAMSERGGIPTFCIVAAGANGAEPHHDTSEDVIREGDIVVMDWGCMVSHYLSDITRTIAVGKASDEAKKIYEIVYKAHMSARSATRPGKRCEEIDEAARKVIEEAGYGKYFVHRTGHGIGIQGHEPPHIVKGSKSLLEPGQCFTVEPGIYLPGKFGVRIENVVTVTENGHESLNAEPPDTLIELDV
ncbi:MAG TPA: Xaa-Pro peptidase family protein [Fimbriimonadales bacterium]|nr:Xaa-Pro peptidase family protein [Fimbriimonadales bacterium]